MEKKPLLFYPIDDDMHQDSEFDRPSKIPCVPIKKFPKVVIVDSLDQEASEGEVLEKLHLFMSDVEDVRLLQDNHRSFQRALITYKTLDAAKAAVTKFHRNPEYGTLCASLVEDLLLDIASLERVVRIACEIRELEQIVDVTTLTKEPGAPDFRSHLIRLFASISQDFLIHIKPEDDDEGALVKFSSLHDAFAAELAYDTLLVDGRKLSVMTTRNPTLVQHDLKVRTTLMWSADQLRLVQKRYIWGTDIPNQSPVGCSNFRCEGCGNKNIVIKSCPVSESSSSGSATSSSS